MNDSDQESNVVNIWGTTPTQKGVEQKSTSLEAYQAVTLQAAHSGYRAYGIKFESSNGTTTAFDYALYEYATLSSPQRLVIRFTRGAAIVIGDNLTGLLDNLLDQRIRSLHWFNPELHKPLKEGQARIDVIHWQSAKAIDEQHEANAKGQLIN